MSQLTSQPGFRSAGQATARAIAQRSATAGRLQRTLLVEGPAGSGKGAFVEDLLALLFCEAGADLRPCNACRGCREARGRTHPDLVVGSPESWREGRSTGESTVAAARAWLAGTAGAPIAGERRVVLIEGLDRANEQTQNALLKALEEPSARQMFVLVADEPTRVLPTIRSRSRSLRIGAVPRAELVDWLVDRERLPLDQSEDLARMAGGMAGTAIGFARSPELVDWRRRTQRELLSLLDRGRADRFSSVRDLLEEASRAAGPALAEVGRDDPTADPAPARVTSGVQRAAALRIVDVWLSLARDLLLSAAGKPESGASAGLLPEVVAAASWIGRPAMVEFIGLLERIEAGLRANAAPRLSLGVAMLSWPSRDRR
jgi:DNA polymerase III, delta subunit